VLIDVQRAGPSTGMPTRSQQSDVLAAAYASHGDTKHVLLFPATPAECFSLTVKAFDLADRLQTPVIMLTDLELGMNDWMSPPLVFDDKRTYDRGKVLDADALDKMRSASGATSTSTATASRIAPIPARIRPRAPTPYVAPRATNTRCTPRMAQPTCATWTVC
jgi:pyruvate/2-oxoacid:ferredoxin oxidoreductase alpha subunit